MQQKTPTEAAFHAMVRTTVLLRRLMEPHFARFGISGAQWGVLRALHRAAAEGHDGVRVTDLSDRLLVRTPSVTNLVTRLERAGMVRRDVSPDDHRVRTLRLTATGKKVVERTLVGHDERMESLLSPLASQERTEMARLLGRVADRLEELSSLDSAPKRRAED